MEQSTFDALPSYWVTYKKAPNYGLCEKKSVDKCCGTCPLEQFRIKGNKSIISQSDKFESVFC
jgi:hypothetical protein